MDAQIPIPEQKRLVRIQVLFESSPLANGTAESPTKNGFVELARLGKDVWNTWRKHYPDAPPDFSGVEFGGNVNFSDYVFSTEEQNHSIDFSKTRFLKRANFQRAKFAGTVDFSNAYFHEMSDFSESTIGDGSDFSEVIFNKSTKFNHAGFGEGISFKKAEFRAWCRFQSCRFGPELSFFRAKFGPRAAFTFSRFGADSSFFGARFGAMVDFRASQFLGYCNFSSEPGEDTSQEAKYFYRIDFGGCHFGGDAVFTGREMKANANFGAFRATKREKTVFNAASKDHKRTEFHGIPYFHQCKFHQGVSFDGAAFKSVEGLEAARAYRTLKLAMEQLKATREEQKFFRLEMRAEHSDLHWSRRWISTLYSLSSDYGFSLWRPVAALLVLSVLFGTGYGWLANLCASEPECTQAAIAANTISSTDRTSDLLKYTLASVAPVPGLDKMQTELRAPLFGQHGWIAVTALVLEIFHKIAALVMVFLFALALRNLFKMKS